MEFQVSGPVSFSENEMNLPNSLTTLRIFFVPLLVVVLLTRQPNWNFWGLPFHFEVWGVLILSVAAATDMMDGYIARKRREVTTLGILARSHCGQAADFRRIYFSG